MSNYKHENKHIYTYMKCIRENADEMHFCFNKEFEFELTKRIILAYKRCYN